MNIFSRFVNNKIVSDKVYRKQKRRKIKWKTNAVKISIVPLKSVATIKTGQGVPQKELRLERQMIAVRPVIPNV